MKHRLAGIVLAAICSALLPMALHAQIDPSGGIGGCDDLGAIDPAMACPICFTCPDKGGLVTVDLRYDLDEDQVLESNEIQCAVDCLDGDIFQERDVRFRGANGFLPPEQIPGGVVEFLPNLDYLVAKPVELPTQVLNSVTLRGNGTTINQDRSVLGMTGSIPVFSRRAPRSSNACDVDWMSGWTNNWVIEGFRFISPLHDPPGPAGPFLKGIEIHGSYELQVRNCQFVSTDVGVEIRWAVKAQVDSCMFTNTRMNDIRFSDNVECLDGVGGDCWQACDGGGPSYYDIVWGSTSGSSGCESCVIRNMKSYAATFDSSDLIVLDHSQNTTIEGAYFDGIRPNRVLLRRDWRPTTLKIEDLLLFVPRRYDERPTHALIDNQSPGLVVVDGMQYSGSNDDFFYDSSSSPSASSFVMQNVAAFPFAAALRGRADDAFAFVNVNEAATPADPRRWLDSAGNAGATPPENLVVYSHRALKLPQWYPSRVSGMLWQNTYDEIAVQLEGTDPASLPPAERVVTQP